MKEGSSRKNSGESGAKHKEAGAPPLTPSLILTLLITHTGTKESTQEGFHKAHREVRDRMERDRGTVERDIKRTRKRGSASL